MSDYTPDTTEIRYGFEWSGHDSHLEENRATRGAQFDQWLEAVKEKVWDEGLIAGTKATLLMRQSPPNPEWVNAAENPYRAAAHD